MYVFRNGTISSSENIITAHRVSPRAPVGYKFARLHYPDIHIPNRGAAWGLFFLPEDSDSLEATLILTMPIWITLTVSMASNRFLLTTTYASRETM